jgi:hypothetical protein
MKHKKGLHFFRQSIPMSGTASQILGKSSAMDEYSRAETQLWSYSPA